MEQFLQAANYTKLWNQISLKHLHTSFEILILLSGKIENTVNESVRTLMPCDVVIMRPGDWHTISLPPNVSHLHRDIYISEQKMREICNFLATDLFHEITQSSEPIYFSIDAARMQILENKLLLFNIKNFDSMDYESFHTCIVCDILSDYTEYKIAHARNHPDWLQNLLSYLNNPQNLSLKTNDLAKLTNYRREHLSREFKKYIGKTLEAYITELRIGYSLSLLSDTNLSIAFIANELGYDSQNSFTNNFKKQYGVTPMIWRKNYQSSNNNHSTKNK